MQTQSKQQEIQYPLIIPSALRHTPVVKVLVLGTESVYKKRIAMHLFDHHPMQQQSPISGMVGGTLYFFTHPLILSIHVWQLASSDRYRTLTSQSARGALLAVIVLRDANFEQRWLELVQNQHIRSVYVVVPLTIASQWESSRQQNSKQETVLSGCLWRVVDTQSSVQIKQLGGQIAEIIINQMQSDKYE